MKNRHHTSHTQILQVHPDKVTTTWTKPSWFMAGPLAIWGIYCWSTLIGGPASPPSGDRASMAVFNKSCCKTYNKEAQPLFKWPSRYLSALCNTSNIPSQPVLVRLKRRGSEPKKHTHTHTPLFLYFYYLSFVLFVFVLLFFFVVVHTLQFSSTNSVNSGHPA